MTDALPAVIPWELRFSLSGERQHSLLYRAGDLPIQKDVHTRMNKGVPGKRDVSYYIDNDLRVFHTEAELRAAWEER